MMNPSTVDALHSDPTVDRIVRYISCNDSEATEVIILNSYAEREIYYECFGLKNNKHSKNMRVIKKIVEDS